MLRALTMATVLGAAAAPATASTPAAWEQMHVRANRACVAMSGLARPQLLASRITYSDAIGVEARLIRGADNRGRAKRLICLYNRRSGRAEVREAPLWTGPTMQP